MLKLYFPEGQYLFKKSDFVAESLRMAILLGFIKPGTKITEQEVKKHIKVSSSPIREAFNQLEAEGVLSKNPHSGTRVTGVAIDDVKKFYSLLIFFQVTAAQICTEKMQERDINEAIRLNNEIIKTIREGINVDVLRILNYKFHMIVCGINTYPWLTKLISALWIHLPNRSVWLVPKEPEIAVKYHEKIIEAIRKGDEILVGSIMRKHLERAKRALYE